MNPILNTITTEALTYFPLAVQAVTGIEAAASTTAGETKAQIAVNIVLAAAKTAAGVPIPSVAAIGGMVALIVGVLNLTGVFSHRPPALVTPVNLGALGASPQLMQGTGQGSGIAAAAQGYGQQTAPPFGTTPVIQQP